MMPFARAVAVLVSLASAVTTRPTTLPVTRPATKPADVTAASGKPTATRTAGMTVTGVYYLRAHFRDERKRLPSRDGLLITSLDKNGPAASAGLGVDDIITSLDKKVLRDKDAFAKWLEGAEINKPYPVTFMRDIGTKWEQRTGTLTLTVPVPPPVATPYQPPNKVTNPDWPPEVVEYYNAVDQYIASVAPEISRMIKAGMTVNAAEAELGINTDKLNFGEDWPIKNGRVGYLRRARIVQIINDTEALVAVADRTILLRGFDVSERADDDLIEERFAVIIDGTDSYVTAQNAKKTVYVAKPYDMSKYRR